MRNEQKSIIVLYDCLFFLRIYADDLFNLIWNVWLRWYFYLPDLLHLLGNTFCSKIRLTENIFPITSTLTLKYNVFRLTKWRHFSSNCTDTGIYLQIAVN